MFVFVSKTKMNPAFWRGSMVRDLALGLIRFYQRWISPLTPPSCFFYPTCSHYTYQAIERFGIARGGWLGLHRVCRCHPLTRGGYDPVPEKWALWPRRIVELGEHEQDIAQSTAPENAGEDQPPLFENAKKTNDAVDAVTDGFRDLDE